MEQVSLYTSEETLVIALNNNITAIDRSTMKAVTVPTSLAKFHQILFYYILGLYKYEDFYYLVLVTDYKEVSEFRHICKITSFEIIPFKTFKTESSSHFLELLNIGLKQCEMYFSTDRDFDITLTQQQYMDRQNCRTTFMWNYESIKTLKECWPSASTCIPDRCGPVIGGFVKQIGNFVIISRKSNKNCGCHTWNRGVDSDGHAAIFVETEEIYIIDNTRPEKINNVSNISNSNNQKSNSFLSTLSPRRSRRNLDNLSTSSTPKNNTPVKPSISPYSNQNINPNNSPSSSPSKSVRFENIHIITHVEIRGSCPIFWSQYPTTQFSKPLRYGPVGESRRRFNKHIDELDELYGKDNIYIVNLTQHKGKELKLLTLYQQFANERNIPFLEFDFNGLMKTPGAIQKEIQKLTDSAEACIIVNGKITQRQNKVYRVNCTSCLDRTNVFMAMMSSLVLQKYGDRYVLEDEDQHVELWNMNSDVMALEYACTPALKTHMTKTGYQPLEGSLHDLPIMIQRYINSLFIEGTISDSYTAVLQEHTFTKFETKYSTFQQILLFLQLVLIFLYMYVFLGKQFAAYHWRKRVKEIINHPHIADLRDADEYDDTDFYTNDGK
ncbi:hypothetical protein TRFO_18132 [Tritrichomonas foetus]|uniref:SAC domain-containing protein n=1 Tax=Tritrichomonas foetus TaxID=1144522 RepID=A0A1J4KLX6_9EUKA|nr:hypothetical protein TRFO_18132 [Tritrichomonas foetus]|eukprot:OHT12219.1 hypothetical protein TRFO_18132 [Tritrichomonas foetus]